MTAAEPKKIWWTCAELAEARLPSMPASVQNINSMATRENWRGIAGCAQRRAGRGGGWEYHYSLLPVNAQTKLFLDAIEEANEDDAKLDRAEAWHRFDSLPETAKKKARDRLAVIQQVEAIYAAGQTHVTAVCLASGKGGVSQRTVYNWLELVEGIAPEDRLAYLVPRYGASSPKVDSSDVRPFLDFLKSAYLRIAGQTFKQCYRKAVEQAELQGWKTLTERTAMRRIEREVPRVSRVYLREGVEGLEKCFPSQIRDRSGLGAMGGVNADCHKIDVFVEWPDGTINRPQIVAFQDLYSNKFLSWRVDHTPNSVMVMSAFGEMIENYGIPQNCLFDNGREFANKWLTGGAPTRFRFKVRDDDPLGVLPLLDIKIHWARPGRGQSKPIERAFRDLANNIAKDPRFSGAYVGNRPDAKPENYGSRAIPAATFLAVLDEGIAEHNARQGRLNDTAQGRSYDETFAESYAANPIRKATAAQRRLWLMGQHVCKLNSNNGSVKFKGNIYHSDWMSNHPSREVVARFNPEDLHDGLSIYDKDGSYVGFAECQQKVGFFDLASAQKKASRDARIKRKERALAEEHAPLRVEDVAAAYDAMKPAQAADLEAKVVSAPFGKKAARMPHERPTYTPAANPEADAMREAMILQMPAAKPEVNEGPDLETKSSRFWRAQELLKRQEEGKNIGKEEAAWVASYVKSAEYQGTLYMFEQYGEKGVR